MDKNVIKQIILRQQELISRITLQPRPLSIEENGNYVFYRHPNRGNPRMEVADGVTGKTKI